LGLIKDFVKAIKIHGKDSEHLREKFPKFSDVKLKEASLLGRKVVESLMMIFVHLLAETEKSS